MATAAINEAPTRTSTSNKLGWALSGLAILFLGTDAGAKIVVPALMAAYTPPQLKIPAAARNDPGAQHRALRDPAHRRPRRGAGDRLPRRRDRDSPLRR